MTKKNIVSLFKPESIVLRFGTILKPRVCWELKVLPRGFAIL